MLRIAVYGKGGIGKSTMSANFSAAFSHLNKKVLQIGCDPKHDSTRLLTEGKKITTVLDYLKETKPDDWKLEDVVCLGFNDIFCVEAGGPEPGVGCAGRGILTTFDLLEKLGIDDYIFDLVLYDVLGDVVCGGFAVPLRKEYAKEVFIVTSGEFMAIYAANNILKGILNFGKGEKRVAGIIFNRRGIERETERVKAFAEAVELPILMEVPRSEEFFEAEREGVTLVEKNPDSEISRKFIEFAKRIDLPHEKYEAKPLDDDLLEKIVLEREYKFRDLKAGKEEKSKLEELLAKKDTEKSKELYLSKNVVMGEPLHGCAYNGAINIATQIEDCVIISHGPKSCAHISFQTITSVGRRALFERGMVLPSQLLPSLVSSEMNEGVMVFGGIEELKEKINEAKRLKPKAILVISSCPSGIIGEDIEVVEGMSDEVSKVVTIKTDGNISGDFLQGLIMAYIDIAKNLIDRGVKAEGDMINVIGEKFVATNAEDNMRTMEELLESIGIEINCRFICKTEIDRIKSFQKAKLNVLAYEDYLGRTIKGFLEAEYGSRFFDKPFPIGYSQTANWLSEIAKEFGKEDLVENVIGEYTETYMERMEYLKSKLKGKKIMMITYSHDLDWLLETMLDLEMDIVKVGILNYSQDNLFKSEFEDRINFELDYPHEKRIKDIEELKPDIFLSNYTDSELKGDFYSDTLPMCPDFGFFSALNLASRWEELFNYNVSEGWKKDAELYNKYYSR